MLGSRRGKVFSVALRLLIKSFMRPENTCSVLGPGTCDLARVNVGIKLLLRDSTGETRMGVGV